MKTILFMAIGAATMMLAGCSNDENESEDNWNGEIRLGSGLVVQQTRAGNGIVPDTQIADGQTVKVFVAKKPSALASTYSGYTQDMTADGNGGLSGTSMYYPEDGDGVSIRAFHPAGAGTTFTVRADQSGNGGKDYFESDLLYSAAKDYPRQKEVHSLSFDHQLCKLTYELKVGDGSPALDGATVQWLGMTTACNFDTSTGAVSAVTVDSENAQTITPHATYGAVVVPQTVTSGTQMLQVALADGGTLVYTPDEDQVLEGGKVYNYTITVNLTELKASSSVKAWQPVAKTGTAVMD